jgi:hypothetical protein
MNIPETAGESGIVGTMSYTEAARMLEHIADTRILLSDEKALCRALARHLRKLDV